jgi:hypothetical protein
MKPVLCLVMFGWLVASSEVPKPVSPCTGPRPHGGGFVCLD